MAEILLSNYVCVTRSYAGDRYVSVEADVLFTKYEHVRFSFSLTYIFKL